jgi:metal-responsive CopG/Arc/MetJ family transcriptional regulator
MQSRRMKISVSLPRDLVARMDRAARVEARSRSRVLEGWLRATARQSAAREVEAATVEYYQSLTASDRREDEAIAAASSAAARRLRVDDPPMAGSRPPRRRTRRR